MSDFTDDNEESNQQPLRGRSAETVPDGGTVDPKTAGQSHPPPPSPAHQGQGNVDCTL